MGVGLVIPGVALATLKQLIGVQGRIDLTAKFVYDIREIYESVLLVRPTTAQ